MAIFATVFRALRQAEISFLVIGGHAVVLLGHHRNTFDLDLLLRESEADRARRALLDLGYRVYFESEAFIQLTPPTSLPPLDLMIVDDVTYSRLSAFGQRRELDHESVAIPDATRLIALKLHSARDTRRERRETDWEDIIGIIRAASLDVENAEFRAIVDRYGGPESLLEIKRRLKPTRFG